MDARQNARMKADDKFLTREERRGNEAERLVGELCREGKTVYYINIAKADGTLTGKTKEFAGPLGWGQAISYLTRNNYV